MSTHLISFILKPSLAPIHFLSRVTSEYWTLGDVSVARGDVSAL